MPRQLHSFAVLVSTTAARATIGPRSIALRKWVRKVLALVCLGVCLATAIYLYPFLHERLGRLSLAAFTLIVTWGIALFVYFREANRALDKSEVLRADTTSAAGVEPPMSVAQTPKGRRLSLAFVLLVLTVVAAPLSYPLLYEYLGRLSIIPFLLMFVYVIGLFYYIRDKASGVTGAFAILYEWRGIGIVRKLSFLVMLVLFGAIVVAALVIVSGWVEVVPRVNRHDHFLPRLAESKSLLPLQGERNANGSKTWLTTVAGIAG